MEQWSKFIDDNESFDIIYTDFSKAFDSVAHERLLVKLENIGIKGKLLKWIRSFLKGRLQKVNGWIEKSSGLKTIKHLGGQF